MKGALMQFCIFPSCFSPLCLDVDDEYEDEEDQWEEGAEDILEKGKEAVWTAWWELYLQHFSGNTVSSLCFVGCFFSVCRHTVMKSEVLLKNYFSKPAVISVLETRCLDFSLKMFIPNCSHRHNCPFWPWEQRRLLWLKEHTNVIIF